ncbi:MAG: Holliday junction branch migration protein RuvA [Paludibacteraceae bacterium]|nr:Holliday junction branch migration protein RuvA [Paludibacteraceae bacterium]
MIEYIKGEITDLTPTYCVLETNGIGYMLNVSLVTYQELQGQMTARLYVYENIREDAHVLYGFLTKAERELFLLLISVSGVGAATARMILSSFTVAELQEIIATGNVNAIKSVKGIGLKSAQRIIVDLKDKIGKMHNAQCTMHNLGVSVNNENMEEAVAALVALGFQKAASVKVVEKLMKEDATMAVGKIVKRALSMM